MANYVQKVSKSVQAERFLEFCQRQCLEYKKWNKKWLTKAPYSKKWFNVEPKSCVEFHVVSVECVALVSKLRVQWKRDQFLTILMD